MPVCVPNDPHDRFPGGCDETVRGDKDEGGNFPLRRRFRLFKRNNMSTTLEKRLASVCSTYAKPNQVWIKPSGKGKVSSLTNKA